MALSQEELERYSRHIILKGVGLSGQKKLLQGKVLVIGAGGLGAPVLMYLAASGVGTLGIMDDDVVDRSNLQRQIIHGTADIGRSKVRSAAARVKDINPHVETVLYEERAEAENLMEILSKYDFIIDAVDSFASKFLINDACVLAKKPFCHGGIREFQGQVMTYVPGCGPCYRCIFEEIPADGQIDSCSQAGVLGTMPGHLPLLVGGTGLYVQSLLYGVRFTAEKAPDGLREQLTTELEANGPEAMYAKLQAVDPEAAAAIHPNNKVRVLRALEHYRATGKRLSEQKADSLPPERPYRSLVLGLDFPDRAALYRRIDLRVDKMLEAGLLAEAEYVWHNREAFRTAAQAIGYKEFFPYFQQTATLEVCTEKLKQASRNYAKRQLTWFRHMDGVTWLDAGAADVRQTALRLTQDFLLKG